MWYDVVLPLCRMMCRSPVYVFIGEFCSDECQMSDAFLRRSINTFYVNT